MCGAPCACHRRNGRTGRCRRRASPGSARYAPERELGEGPVSYRVEQWCAGCGICEHVCPNRAVTIQPGAQPAYTIDPLRCDDCARCVVVCPVEAVRIDPGMARCRGRGCPLSSRRHAATQCTQADAAGACPRCGGPQWRSGIAPWSCPRCTGASSGASLATCPKPGQVRRQAAVAGLAAATAVMG